jgi:FSR family fosmidomycin resistance protein-like MFS transporter
MNIALRRRVRAAGALMLVMLLIEFLDEFSFGTREAAWPLIREDLGLSYTQIGLLIGLPTLTSALIEPFFGIFSTMGFRKPLVVFGGVMFVVSLLAFALTPSFEVLLLTEIILYPASGAFVGLAQGVLMDSDRKRHEPNMARWTLAGSIGIAVSPLLLALAVAVGFGWREQLVVIALLAIPVIVATARLRFPSVQIENDDDGESAPGMTFRDSVRDVIDAARQPKIVRWYVLLIFSDFMLDLFHGFIALYFVDVVGGDAALGGLAVAVWTGVGLLGDVGILRLLEKVPGLVYMRWSALANLFAYPAFLLVPSVTGKLILIGIVGILNAGWYSVLQAQTYTALDGRSGTEATLSNLFTVFYGVSPLLLGVVANEYGLAATMWVLLIAPIAMLIGIPRQRRRAAPGAHA